jgi:Exodeoxyribonuclease V, gamma subunit
LSAVRIAAALARTLERLVDRAASYAEMCRSDETDELLQAREADDPSAWKRFRDLLGRSGLEPPDTDLLAWGQVMGLEEARVREQVAIALEEAARSTLAPVLWLLERADGGVALTETGALNRALVREAVERWPALQRVRGSLFTAPAKPAIEPDGTIRLVSAPDPAREVRAAARACLQWAQEGVGFWEMAVAYRHGEAYRPLVEAVFIEAVFIEAGIPVYLHEGSPLAERPLGRQTLALLDLYESDFSRRSVMDFLTDARLPKELRDEFGGAPASRWDSVSRQAGVVAGAERWAQRLAVLQRELIGDGDQDDTPSWVAERAADAGELARFIADLHARLQGHPGRAP